jgi:hypothetical protein
MLMCIIGWMMIPRELPGEFCIAAQSRLRSLLDIGELNAAGGFSSVL